MDGLTPEEIHQVKDMCIHQMASMETRAQFMQDFIISRSAMADEDFTMPVPDYWENRDSLYYDALPCEKELCDLKLSPAVMRYYKYNYPFLDMDKLKCHLYEAEVDYDMSEYEAMADTSVSDVRCMYHNNEIFEMQNHAIMKELADLSRADNNRTPTETAWLKLNLIADTEDLRPVLNCF